MTPVELAAFTAAAQGLPPDIAEDLAWLIAHRPDDCWWGDRDAAETGRDLAKAIQKWHWHEDMVRVYPDRYSSLSAKELIDGE